MNRPRGAPWLHPWAFDLEMVLAVEFPDEVMDQQRDVLRTIAKRR